MPPISRDHVAGTDIAHELSTHLGNKLADFCFSRLITWGCSELAYRCYLEAKRRAVVKHLELGWHAIQALLPPPQKALTIATGNPVYKGSLGKETHAIQSNRPMMMANKCTSGHVEWHDAVCVTPSEGRASFPSMEQE